MPSPRTCRIGRKPRSPEGLKKNLRRRDGRWYWHWDPAFLTAPNDDTFVRMEKLEQAAIDLTIPILLIRGKLSDVVSDEGVKDFLEKVPRAEFVELSDAGTPPRATTTTRSPKSWCSSSAGDRRSGFNFLEEPELPAPQVSEAQAEEILRDALRAAGPRDIAGQPAGQELRGHRATTARSSGC